MNHPGRADLIADVQNSLGSLHAALGDRAAALSSYEQALVALRNQPSRELAEAHYEMARLKIAEGRLTEALQCAQSALRVAETLGSEVEVGRSMLALGQALLGLEDYDAAIPYLQRALKVFAKKGQKLSAVVVEDLLRLAERRAPRALAHSPVSSNPDRIGSRSGNT